MGTGKSSVGHIASHRLNLSFLDSDQEIEKKTGRSISEIFSSQGEQTFRSLEKDYIQNGHPSSGCLISCGGGLPIPEGMIEFLKSKGKVFCLWANPETILKRTQENNDRPLLQKEDPMAEIEKLLRMREKKYLLADQVISTEQRSPKQVAEVVAKNYLELVPSS